MRSNFITKSDDGRRTVLSSHAWQQVHRRAVDLLHRTLPDADPESRRVLTALLTHTALGWHLCVLRDRSQRQTCPDAVLIGPTGVTMVSIGTVGDARAVVRYAEERLVGIRGQHGRVLPPSAVHFALIGSADLPPHFRVLDESRLKTLFRSGPWHLNRAQVGALAAQVDARLADFTTLGVEAPARRPAEVGLLNADVLAEDQLAAAQQRSFDTWLTFLHPRQQAVVTRHYNGPARISGPAGTGKTVVALHRLRHLARRSTGPLLFTTFVRTLPTVHQVAFRKLAPELVGRVEFTNLHSWVRDFLSARGREVNVQPTQARTAFSRAWMTHRETLAPLEPNPSYWRTEIDRVIKGRGLRTFQEYAAVDRRGRTRALRTGNREPVWQLYLTYERMLADKGVDDHNDMIAAALDELREQPLDKGYAAVVVDEVQDITLTGLRLLLELGGAGPDGLLLVGDGQQQVYAGGWRLSDAGIPIHGRGEVLRVNYRNRRGVLDFAKRINAANVVDDLDGAAGVTLRQAEVVAGGGEVHRWQGTYDELPEALLAATRAMPVPLENTAVITFGNPDAERCTRTLQRAGLPILNLADFTGEPGGQIKIGTVHRAKGLDFQAVLVVETPLRDDADEEQNELRNRQRLVAATRARDHLWWGQIVPAADGRTGPRRASGPSGT
jgi:hypothetical protein